MKKFFFSLDTVLNYKEQALDGLKAEHARILAKVRECERTIEKMEEEHRRCTAEFRNNRMNGMKICDNQKTLPISFNSVSGMGKKRLLKILHGSVGILIF